MSLLTSAALSALKTNRMPPRSPLEEREKGWLDPILQAIPLLMNFSLPQRYNNLLQISSHMVFGV